MKKEQNVNSDTTSMDEDYLYSASCTDCTGLTPTPAHDEFEAESYQELAPYLPPIAPATAFAPGPLLGEEGAPLPPYNHGRTTDDIHLEMRPPTD